MRWSALALLFLASLCTTASAASTAQEAAAKSGRIMMFGRAFSLTGCGDTVGFGAMESSSIQVGNAYTVGGKTVAVHHIDVTTVAEDIVLGDSVAFHKGQTTCRAYDERRDLPLGLQCGRIWIYIADCEVLH